MSSLEALLRAVLSLLGRVRAFSKGPAAVGRRAGRRTVAHGSVRALDRTMGWRRYW
jgi:hypothetical protein